LIPSSETKARSPKASRLPFATFTGFFAYIALEWLGIIPMSWSPFFFAAYFVALFFAVIILLREIDWAYHEKLKSDHPDPDVSALMNGEIDIPEYRRRTDHAERKDGG